MVRLKKLWGRKRLHSRGILSVRSVTNMLKGFSQNIRDAVRIAKFLLTGYQVNALTLIKDCFVNYFTYGIFSNKIRIDASNICQLQCPLCWQVQEKNKTLKRCYLKFDDFKKFIDTYPTFRNIELSDNGEIFLNPELKDIIRYAYEKKVNLAAENGVNLNTVSEETLECLVKYRFRAMVISIDGATNDTYQIYRRGGKFDNVIEHIEKINYFKQKYNTKLPRLIWQFVIFGHNEHELPLAREKAKKLNMLFVSMINYVDQSYSPVKDGEFIRKENTYISQEEYENKTKSLYIFPCIQFWFAPQISPDGELLGCCANNSRDATFGNVFTSGLKRQLRSEKFIYAKKMLLGKKEPRKDILCFYCKTYSKIQSRKINLVNSLLENLKRFI